LPIVGMTTDVSVTATPRVTAPEKNHGCAGTYRLTTSNRTRTIDVSARHTPVVSKGRESADPIGAALNDTDVRGSDT
jgi:hypothetical protein